MSKARARGATATAIFQENETEWVRYTHNAVPILVTWGNSSCVRAQFECNTNSDEEIPKNS